MKKSLLDIQQEIRALDGKVKDISTSISQIYEELDELRNDKASTIDYERICFMASHFRFGTHPLARLEDGYACRNYLEMLLSLTQVDCGADATVSRLIFIQWILLQSKLDISLEDLLYDSLKINSASFGELVEILPKPYHSQLVMDALITANICGQAREDVLIYVAGLCSVLGISKEELCMLSVIAKGILKQDLGRMKKADLRKFLSLAKDYEHYLNADYLNARFRSQRTLAVEAPDETHHNFKWKVKQKAQVEKGDVIATYIYGSARLLGTRNKWTAGTLTEIKAPCAGTIFQFRNHGINYGVIAHENDNKDSIKAWVTQRK